MKTSILFITLFTTTISLSFAQDSESDAKDFANTYFAAWNKTQAPEASETDLENFLDLLTDDVGFQHLPYRAMHKREPTGKETLRKGMSQWLGANTSYSAKLIEINYGHNVVILKYQAIMTVIDDKTGKEKSITRNNIEVLELDEGKVAVIRKYGKY